ncbi:MAG TPA: hypothetical protein VG734_00765 [Lacunisphaera sp.]|nr:hypothetical protein [Lacunisphaera sp.]
MKSPRVFAGLLAVLAAAPLLRAMPVPHPDRPGRLVETRDGFSVEYSPGQEAWMEMGFAELKAQAARPAPAAPEAPVTPPPAVVGSAQHLQENRELILAAVARQVGLAKPTPLQGRVFDTFLGYYKMNTELMRHLAQQLPPNLTPHHLAIWQREDLVARLRAGAQIEGLSYDPATDSGNFSFHLNTTGTGMDDRLREIQAEIDAQKLKHEFTYGDGQYDATIMLGKAPEPKKAVAPKETVSTEDLATMLSRLVVPVIYRGDQAAVPDPKEFAYIQDALQAGRAQIESNTRNYRDPNLVTVILHETAESGLVENVIGSRDRRWLCDGTANYVAWRVARDLMGPEFARQVYDLDAQLRQHAPQQPKIDLAAWSAVERGKKHELETGLNRAHYAFATRAMFLLTARHGDDAVAQLWSDVARTPRKKVSAKTFAEALRKRFNGDIRQLIAAAEKNPIPPAPSPPVVSNSAASATP